MENREYLNTKEGFDEIINETQLYIENLLNKIVTVEEDEKKGINRFPKSNSEVITATRHTIFTYYLDLVFSMYSAGYPIIEIKKLFPKLLEQKYCNFLAKKENDFTYYGSEPFYGTDEYWEILQVLSLGVLLNVDEESKAKILYIRDKIPTPDVILDFLSSHFDKRKIINTQLVGNKFNGLVDVIIKHSAENLPKLMSDYLKKQWMKDYKRQGFLTTHNSGMHVGYWSFESGAIMKILKSDDSILKGQQFYPYDMVNWQ